MTERWQAGDEEDPNVALIIEVLLSWRHEIADNLERATAWVAMASDYARHGQTQEILQMLSDIDRELRDIHHAGERLISVLTRPNPAPTPTRLSAAWNQISTVLVSRNSASSIAPDLHVLPKSFDPMVRGEAIALLTHLLADAIRATEATEVGSGVTVHVSADREAGVQLRVADPVPRPNPEAWMKKLLSELAARCDGTCEVHNSPTGRVAVIKMPVASEER